MACTLNPEQLERRLKEIAEVAADSFVSAESSGGDHVLRFRADPETQRRLETIVAAEAECCSFLDLRVDDAGDELVLSIDAPARGRDTAAGLAAAFAGASVAPRD